MFWGRDITEKVQTGVFFKYINKDVYGPCCPNLDAVTYLLQNFPIYVPVNRMTLTFHIEVYCPSKFEIFVTKVEIPQMLSDILF